MLQLLKAVPGSEGQAQVAAAFQSVQLLASDYMSTLPPGLLPPCLDIVSLYAQQQVGQSLRGLSDHLEESLMSLMGVGFDGGAC